MERPEPITARPVTLDMARDQCERLYADYREASHFDTVALMMMAWNKAYVLGRVAAFEESLAVIRKPLPPKDDDERGIMDLAREMKEACDTYDELRKDRRTLAREVNAENRTRWVR